MQFSSSLCKPENVVRFLQKRFFGKLFHRGVCFGSAFGGKRGHSVFMMITHVGVSSVYIIIANLGVSSVFMIIANVGGL
jgi:hypothetical protein